MSRLPKVKLNRMQFFKKLKNLPGATTQTAELYLNGDGVVFVKTVEGYMGLEEARWLVTLNRLGIGVPFHGVQIQGNSVVLAMDYIPVGLETKFLNKYPKNFKIYESALNEILYAGQVLKEAGLKYAADMQFIISKDGRHAYLIDPTLFGIKFDKKTAGDQRPEVAAQRIVQSLAENFQILQ